MNPWCRRNDGRFEPHGDREFGGYQRSRLRTGHQDFLIDPFAHAWKDVGPLQNKVAAATNAHESFRLVGECEQSPSVAYRNDVVFLSMNDCPLAPSGQPVQQEMIGIRTSRRFALIG